jgi:hypothetical protein
MWLQYSQKKKKGLVSILNEKVKQHGTCGELQILPDCSMMSLLLMISLNIAH